MRFSELLSATKQGNQEALSELHRRYAPRVFARIRQRLTPMLRRRYDTLDLAQSVFAEVLRDLDRIEDRGESAFCHLMYIKAENKVRKKLRRHLDREGRRREMTLDSAHYHNGDVDPAVHAEHSENQRRLREMLSTLDETGRALLILRGQQNLSHEAIAKRLGLPSANAARMRYSRALVALRERWKNS